VASAVSQLQQYLNRFRTRLKPLHALWIRQTLSVLQGLAKISEGVITSSQIGKVKAEMLDANTLMSRVGGGNDQVNLVEMVQYLKDSKLARKVSGFAEKTAEQLALKGEFLSSLPSTHARKQSFTEHDSEARFYCFFSPCGGVLAIPHGRPG